MDTTKLDAAIEAAIKRLSQSERGRQALADFVSLMDNGAVGLDGPNCNALCVLVLAAMKEGRREFIQDIKNIRAIASSAVS